MLEIAEVLALKGHDIHAPRDRGFEKGVNDPVHLTLAIRDDRAFLTKNYADFEELHDLVMAGGGHHPGILIVREDNDARRDLRPHQIGEALGKLVECERLGNTPIRDNCHFLNDYR